MAMTKIKGLQMWCRKMAEGYAHVDITNFTTSWRNGMAFCAIIHRFRPDLIDYDALNPENVYENCKLAFEIAEKELNIPAFLEAEDMARLKVPDKLSVITYVSQYYNFLSSLPQLGGPGVKGKVANKSVSGTKRPPQVDNSQAPTTKKATTLASKENTETPKEKAHLASMGDKCNICQNKVYLLERHVEGGKLYHRSCFRHSELSPANKVYTRSPFLSPALSSENSLSPSHISGDAQPRFAFESVTSTKVNTAKSNTDLSPVSRRADVAGMKHPLAEADRDDTKKSKLQPKTLFDEDKLKKAAALKDKLHNLKATYTEENKIDANQSLPFTSKEAKKLQKRKEEILASEKSAGDSVKGAKRNVPLIFQHKDKVASDAAKTVSSSPSSSKTAATSASKTSSSLATSLSSTVTTGTKTSVAEVSSLKTGASTGKAVSSKSEAGADFTKVELKSVREHKNPYDDKQADPALKKKSPHLPDVQNLQKLYSAKPDPDPSLQSKALQPVAKPRSAVHKYAGGDTGKHESKDLAALTLSKSDTPKATPRKSLVDMTDKKSAPEQTKQFPQGTKSQVSDTSGDSAPPLPTSPPPPLPPTEPKGEVGSSASEKNKSTVLTDNKTSIHHRKVSADVKPISTAGTSETGLHSFNTDKHTNAQVTAKDSGVSIKVHAPVKSQVEANTTHKSTSKSSDRRWSTPTATDKEPQTIFVGPSETKGEGKVLTGLLASLAGVRGRAASVPGVTDLTSPPLVPVSMQSSSTSAGRAPLVSSAQLSQTSTHTEKTAENSGPKDSGATSSKALLNTGPSDNSHKASEALTVLNSLKHVSSTKTDIKLTNSEQLSSRSKTSESTSVGFHKSAAENGVKTQTHLTSQNKNSNQLNKTGEDKVTKVSLASAGHISITSDHPKPLSSLSKNLSSSKEALDKIQLKRVMPEHKKTVAEPKAEPFDVKLKKVDAIKGDEKWNSAPHKSLQAHTVPETSLNGALTASSQINSNAKEMGRNAAAEVPSLMKDSAVKISIAVSDSNRSDAAVCSKTHDNDDLPQWKKDIEERKKKMREDIAKSEMNAVRLNNRGKESKTDRPKSEDVLSLVSDDRTALRPKSPDLTARSSSEIASRRKSFDVLETAGSTVKSQEGKQSVVSSHISFSNQEVVSKLDWQKEAEKKRTRLASSLCEEDDKPKKMLPKTPTEAPVSLWNKHHGRGTDVVTDGEKSDSDLPRRSEEGKEANLTSQEKRNSKLKDSEMEFMVNKIKLKHIAVDVDISVSDRPKTMDNTQNKSKQGEEIGKGDDFREKLHNLKHVVTAEDKKMDLSKNVTKSLILDANGNINHNNIVTLDSKEQKPVSDAEHIHKLSNKAPSTLQTIPLASSAESSNEEKEIPAHKSSQDKSFTKTLEEKTRDKTSPKVRKKITPLGDKKGFLDSLSSTAKTPMKRIEAPSKIDFDESTDLELSLTESTAKLTIRNKHKPPARPPPPVFIPQQNVVSPHHISALELQKQLKEIDSRLTDLELRGRELEDCIREDLQAVRKHSLHGYRKQWPKFSHVNTHDDDDEDLMIRWFELITEKNELVRKEADLVYLSREQDLESEQERIESQLRYLISKSDKCKSPEEKQEEDYLINRKVQLVEQRNKIVDSMDEDRLRYVEEDKDLQNMLKGKGLLKGSASEHRALKGKKIAKSKFYI